MAWKNVCPIQECEGKRFKNLDNLKKHMEEVHGGYTASDIAESGELPTEEPGAESQAPAPRAEVIDFDRERETRPPAERPRKSSKMNRELNDSLNEVLELQVRHTLGVPLTPEQAQRLMDKRAEVRNALIGFEFNFDDRVVKLEHPFFRILITIILVILPFVPTLPELRQKMAEQKSAAEKVKNPKKVNPPPTPIPVPSASPTPAPVNASDDTKQVQDEAAKGLMVEA